MTKLKASKVYERSVSGLRDALFDEIQDLRDGVATPTEAKAMSDLAGRIIETLNMEIRAEELAQKKQKAIRTANIR